MDRLKHIWQIYYDDTTLTQVWDQFKPFHNPVLSPFFENEPIRHIIEKNHIPSDVWFGVLSPEFDKKAKGVMTRQVTKPGLAEKLQECEDRGIHILGFSRHTQQRNNITAGDPIHRRGESPSFSEVFKMVIEAAGIEYNVKNRLRTTQLSNSKKQVPCNFMSNYVIARFWVYKKYYDEVLKPCMKVMEENEEISTILWEDSKYYKNRKMREQAKIDLGVNYYPLHTFIAERFWSMFVNMNKQLTFDHY